MKLSPTSQSTGIAGAPVSPRPRSRVWRWLPIRRLSQRHRVRVLRHLLSLSERDRYLRFGYPASDERIEKYVETLDFQRSELFGIFDRRLELVAISQLAYAEPVEGDTSGAMVEFAVSVRSHARGRGYGDRLFNHALRRARNRSIDRLMIHALSENTAMLRIARKAGAEVRREGSESEAWLQLPPHSLASRMEELLADRISALNYRVKVHARQVGWMLALVHEIRHQISRRCHAASQ